MKDKSVKEVTLFSVVIVKLIGIAEKKGCPVQIVVDLICKEVILFIGTEEMVCLIESNFLHWLCARDETTEL